MKKTILSIACSIATALTFAQIPNFSFENWTTVGTYSNPDNWGTMNNTTSIANIFTATKGTPGNPGTAYLKLTSKAVTGFGVVNGIAVSGQFDSITMQPKTGFSFTQRPANFAGRWQHMIYGSSQGSILVTLTRWDSGLNQRVAVGSASTTLSGMAMSWANFSLPFTYVDGGYPDTCIIVLKSSGATPTDNDYLWLDNLSFVGTVTGTMDHGSLLKSINIYPNPTSNNVILDLNLSAAQNISFEIKDLSGKTVLNKNAGILQGQATEVINVSGLSKGTYFIIIKNESVSEIRKIIIE